MCNTCGFRTRLCLQEKEAGAAAYKARDFDKALEHFNKAVELYDKDVSFLTNRAAVHMERGDIEAVMKDCESAVEKARQIMPVDFKIIAKCVHSRRSELDGRVYFIIQLWQNRERQRLSVDLPARPQCRRRRWQCSGPDFERSLSLQSAVRNGLRRCLTVWAPNLEQPCMCLSLW